MTRARHTPEERRAIWRECGRRAPGNFKNNPTLAVDAGRAGGFASPGFRDRDLARRAAQLSIAKRQRTD